MSLPYIQARNHGGTQSAVNRIVIHATVSPCVRGGAKSIANYFHTTSREASAHYVVDPGQVYQCLLESTIAWHAPPNTGSIGIELCDPQSGSASRWQDANHEAMLRLAASLVRAVAARWNVPLTKLSAADLKAGKRGICGHVDVSNAWHLTDHSDPGTGFPWAHFMDLVKGEDDDMPEPKDLWNWDGIPAPPWIAEDGNTNWTPASYLHWSYRNQAKLTEKVDALTADLAEIKALLAAKPGA